MDVDYLRHRHADCMMRAAGAKDAATRASHQQLGDFYAKWIAEEEARVTGDVPASEAHE